MYQRGYVISRCHALAKALAFGVVLTCAVAPTFGQALIGLNFGSGTSGNSTVTTPMAPTESAGVVAQTNWNNITGGSGTATTIVNNLGSTATGVTATYSSVGVYDDTAVADTAGNLRMMRGYLDLNGGTTTATVSGLSNLAYFDVYSVNVYTAGDGNNRVGKFTIGSKSYWVKDNATFAGTFTQGTGSTDPGNYSNATAGNYMVFSNLTGDSFSLAAVGAYSQDGILRAPVNAIQIVAQNILYWDKNGTTAGAGTTPSGTWSTSSASWSNSAGTAAASNWTSGYTAVFSAGTDATGNYTVTVSGTQNTSALIVEEGNPTFTGGTINFTDSTPDLMVTQTTSTVTVNSAISSATGLNKSGAGTLILGNTTNAYTGATTISAGTLQLGTSNVIPDGSAVTVASGATFNLNNYSETIGSLAGAGNVTLGSGTLTTGADNTSTGFSGIISGSGNLAKTGTGTLTLSGVNTYAGTTTISGGVLSIGADSSLGAAPGSASANEITLNGGTLQTSASMTLNSNRGIALGASGGTLDANSGTTLTYGGIIAGSGALTKADTGTLVLSGANTYTGATNINAGTLQLGAANTISNSSAVTVASGATFNLNNNSDTVGSIAGAGNVTLGSAILTAGGDNTSTTVSGVISGAGALSKAGTGTLVLSGANTYSGATTVSAGVLNIQNNTALGTSTTGTTVLSGAAIQIQNGITVTGETLTLSGTGISNDGALRNVSGNNTWTGAVVLGAASRINSDAGTLTISGGISGSGQDLSVGGAGSTVISGVIGTTTGSLTKDGAGTAKLSAVNTYTGATNINAGTLQLGVTNAISSSSAVTVASGATLSLNGYNEAAGSLAGAGNVTLGANTLTAGANGTSTTFSGVISGTGGLTKTASGTLTLSGANSYTGATNINGGTLALGANSALSTSTSVTIASGANFTLNGYAQQIAGLSGSGIVTLGGGTLGVTNFNNTTFSGSFASNDTGLMIVGGSGSLTFGADMNLAGGTLELMSGTLNLGGHTSTFGSLHVVGNSTLNFSGTSFLNLNSIVVDSGVTLTVTNWSDAVDFFDSVNNPGSDILGRIVFTGYTGANTKWQSFDHEITPVPEPSTYGAVFMVLGLSAGMWWRRRRQLGAASR